MDGRETDKPGRRKQLIELLVFLFLIVPSMALSFVVTVEAVRFPALAISNILRDLALLSLVLYFVWSSGESFRALGLKWDNLRQEALLGVALFIPFYLAAALLASLLGALGFPGPQEPPAGMIPIGAAEYLLALVFLVVVAVSEEAIFRGYLLLRLGNITGNIAAAVILSSIIFSVGHGYQGATGVVVVGVLGLLFAVIYLWRGSLVAPIVMHFLQNFMGIIVVPLLA